MTLTRPADPSCTPGGYRSREILDRVGDKWSLHVVARLATGPRRFTELRHGIDGISQRMLTVTLRSLERDGIVTRRVYEVMPPHVEYALTPLGHTLLDVTKSLIEWADEHVADLDAARAAYDERKTDTGISPA